MAKAHRLPWFDKLTMSGGSIPLTLSLSKDERWFSVMLSEAAAERSIWWGGETLSGGAHGRQAHLERIMN
jgi:hypothetical protein